MEIISIRNQRFEISLSIEKACPNFELLIINKENEK